ncbi:MAG: lytic transglycosylase domain-containing protein [Acetobacteraceae bacterium]|nr:lytic transglycosylase domain-containing protein [Acetobacteraceae bacterium]
MPIRPAAALGLLALLLAVAACAPPPARYGHAWDGRRGYDGRGDYGYDLDASHRRAVAYRAAAGRAAAGRAAYPPPGPPGDPWGPLIREAATRFDVPERWIREVMRQESGGRTHGGDGLPITSSAGAMGLMQVMPETWEGLRRRHGLGHDPHAPRDNILAGAAYIREMYDRFGSPHFLAAYNAGPERTEAYLAGATILPDETVNYLASIAPRLGIAVPGPGGRRVAPPVLLAAATRAPAAADLAYAGGGMVAGGGGAEDASLRAYAGGGMRGEEFFGDASMRAFDGGGLVTPSAPTGVLTPWRGW